MRPRLHQSSKRWPFLIGWYVLWNVTMYVTHGQWLIASNRTVYDYCYWVGERVFVVLALWTIAGLIGNPYKWIVKTFMFAGMWKLVYLLLVISGKLKANDKVSLMGIMFTITLAGVIQKWGRLSRK